MADTLETPVIFAQRKAASPEVSSIDFTVPEGDA
jgi:hypothetical protein